MQLDPTYLAAGSLILNLVLMGAVLFFARSTGGSGKAKRVLFIWTGRGLIPVTVKAGQKQYVWKRPDGTRVGFNLDNLWVMPYGKNENGTCWVGDGASGSVMRWDPKTEALQPLEWDASTKTLKAGEAVIDEDARKALQEATKGTLFRVQFNKERSWPDGNYWAAVIEDTREEKWFREGRAAQSAQKMKLGILLMICAGVLIFFWFQSKKNGG